MTLILNLTKLIYSSDKNGVSSKSTFNARWIDIFEQNGGLEAVAKSYKHFGLNLEANNDVIYREWAPAAKSVTLFGDFNDWDRE